MTFPKVKFEATFTIGNVITLALLVVAAVGGWFDMRGSIKELSSAVDSSIKELNIIIENDRRLAVLNAKILDVKIDTTGIERNAQLKFHEQRITTIEKSLISIGELTTATSNLRIEITNLSKAVEKLEGELRTRRGQGGGG